MIILHVTFLYSIRNYKEHAERKNSLRIKNIFKYQAQDETLRIPLQRCSIMSVISQLGVILQKINTTYLNIISFYLTNRENT
jgi:hypothetical protein